MGAPLPSMVGKFFGEWEVLADSGPGKRRKLTVRHSCGTVREALAQQFTRSDGAFPQRCSACYLGRGHGHKTGGAPSAEYAAWCSMVQRCTNSRSKQWKNYGGRGITVAPEWLGDGGFERFLAHVGPRPEGAYSLDRKETNGNYEPGNVRWATWETQQNNRRSNKLVTIDGVTQTLATWGKAVAAKVGGSPRGAAMTLSRLMRDDVSPEDAFARACNRRQRAEKP